MPAFRCRYGQDVIVIMILIYYHNVGIHTYMYVCIYIYMYLYIIMCIYIYIYMYVYIVYVIHIYITYMSIRKVSNRGSQIPEPSLISTSKMSLERSNLPGAGPIFQIDWKCRIPFFIFPDFHFSIFSISRFYIFPDFPFFQIWRHAAPPRFQRKKQ